TGHAIKEAFGKTYVEGIRAVALDGSSQPIAGRDMILPCDTIVIAIGAVPNVELLDVLGCHLTFQSAQGRYLPIVDGEGRTSVPCVYAVGECAGTFDEKLIDARIAVAEGRRAGEGAARALGAEQKATALSENVKPLREPTEVHSYWRHW